MIRTAILFVIRLYQMTLSRLIGPTCRFEPSCSRYTATCIERFGVLHGSWLGMKRIARCHPLNPGGYDPPPHPEGCPPHHHHGAPHG
jgi:putative membrane protein insertion efficiency factor